MTDVADDLDEFEREVADPAEVTGEIEPLTTTVVVRPAVAADPASRAHPEPAVPRWSVIAARVCLVAALVGGWCLVYVFGLSRFEEARSQHALYTQLRSELAALTAPVQEPIAVGDPIALMSVPAIGIRDLVVVQGTSASALQDGPGHQRGTPLPGQVGVTMPLPPSLGIGTDANAPTSKVVSCTILGRGTAFGAPFGDLGELHRGDGIVITTGEGRFVYAVLDVRTSGDPEPAPPSGARSLLTLGSTDTSGTLGWLTPHRAVYVDAVLQTPGLPSTALSDQPLDPGEDALAGDHSWVICLELALAVIALAASLAALRWSRNRWGGVQRWVVAAPVLAAVSWALSDVSVQLLPNVF